jgi:Dolichyl-phosphate-mannose-protein mannosyltransferase
VRVSPTAVAPIHVRAPANRVSTLAQVARSWCVLLSIVAIGSGVYMRAWYLWHRPISSDEAIAGLMARHILHGHFFAFYWGQVYGGVEPYLTSAGFGIFGTSAWVLRAVPVLLSIGAALLTWRVTRRLVNDSVLAVLAGAIVWAAPDSAVSNSFIEWGFRGVTLLCGLAILLFALRILDGRDQWWNFGLMGLFVGVGWWSSPELIYYLVPAGLIMAGFLWSRGDQLTGLLPGLGALVVTTGIGMLPWLWANAQSGFKSLKTSSFGAPPQPITYHGRLSQFFHYSLGMLFSLRDIFDGKWLGGKRVGEVLLILVLVALGAAMALAVIRGGRAIAIVVAVIVFPFVMAVSPATWYWQTGRYIGYVVPLYVMVLAVGAFAVERVASSRKRAAPPRDTIGSTAGRFSLSVVGAFMIAMALLSFVKDPSPGVSLSAGWGDPNKPSTPVIRALEKGGVTYGYANYWVAYRLDLLTKEHLKITVGQGDFDRWPPYTKQVDAQSEAAWIFVKSTQSAVLQWLDTAGPGGTTEAGFINQLKADSIGYRVVDAGTLDAVIPTSPVAPSNFWAQS